MKMNRNILWATFLAIFMLGYAFGQQTGDYQSAATGNWSDAATWEVFNGESWSAASTAPTGAETITVEDDTVHIDTDVTISDTVVVTGVGVIDSVDGSITFADGGVYNHARDGGNMPIATWEMGSTALFTGITGSTPGNRGQDYYNLTLNTPDMLSNRDMSLGGRTIGGDLTLLSSGAARWRLIGGSSGTITIMGDVIVEDGSLETQGTGSLTDVIVNHWGNINVSGGQFSISRGSQSSGAGTTTWNLLGGDFTMSDAETRNSNPTAGNAKFVFAKKDTQEVTFTNVTYGGGSIHFKVADSTILKVNGDFVANGLFINEGDIVPFGTLTFADGSVYDHARDEGTIPTATWETGSTYMLTGITSSAPGNRNQNFYNITLNTPNMTSNRDLGLDDVTVGGDIHVMSSGSARWRLTSTSGGDTAIVTIMGDLIVEGGSQFETQGTGNAFTTFIVHQYGDINVTDANFSVSRGSQGNGTGTTTWNLYQGDFTFTNGQTRNSNPTPGNAKLVFASPDSQEVTFTDVEYAGGQVHFKVSDSTKLKIVGDFSANGLFINEGEIEPSGTLTFMDGSTYEHARDGGDMPDVTWEEGSTALLTGITGSAPGNRGQDYYHLTLDTDSMVSNRDMDLDGHTISGNVTLLSSGSARWRLVGGSSGTITIMGDVIVEDGSLETQGTSSATEVEVLHYGNVIVNGGTFAVSRGSQGGVGTTKWYLLDGDFSIMNATTRNSNPDGATFIFAKEGGSQNIILSNVDYGSGGLPVQVDSAATLNMDTTIFGGSGNFVLNAYATLATANTGGLDSTIQSTGDTTFSKEANFTFNGTAAQVPGAMLPDTIGVLTVANAAGVSFNDTTVSSVLDVTAGSLMHIDTLGSVAADTGAVAGTIVNKGDLQASGSLVFADGSVYEHARNEGDVPNGVWMEGSTMLMTGTTDQAPGNRNQSYYNLTLNTPGLSSNRDMGLDDVTIGGDLRVINSGSSRWRLTSASGGDTAIVNIMGDVIVEGGSFETQGTSNALTVFEVHHYGDVNVTGGTFAVSRGSQGDGSGSTRWFMHEGNFSINNAQTRNSNPTNAWFVFDKDTVQTITLTDATYGGGGLPIKVVSGAMLDFGVSQLGGSGLFELEEGATLITANEGGVDSTLQNSGDLTLSESASFTFNGTATQVTGLAMPTTVENLTIDNAAGVKLSQETTINGILWLVLGVFDNTISFTLGPDGAIVYGEGSLLIVDDIESELSELPKKFALYQNYPNPFNPSTTISYDLPKQAPVTITIFDVIGRQVAKLVDGEHSAGAYSVTWDASGYASGLYYYQIEAGNFVSVRKLVLMK